MIPEYIVIHHSLTQDGSTVSWDAIRQYHLGKGWNDIGYHFGVERIGNHYEILMGRTPSVWGAHAAEAAMNRRSIGICLVGNFDESAPPKEQLDEARKLVNWLRDTYHLNRADVIGHREVGLKVGLDWRTGQYKSCPGKLFDMDSFRGML